MSRQRERIAFPRSELTVGGRRLVTVGRREIAVLNVDGALYALYNRCPHTRAPLIAGLIGGTNLPSEVGTIRRGMGGRVLQCPWHHFEFDLVTGRCISAP